MDWATEENVNITAYEETDTHRDPYGTPAK